MPVFPILRSKVHILRRFLKILCRRASARLQLLEVLHCNIMYHLSKGRPIAYGLNIWFTLFCHNFKFVVIYVFFSAKSVLPKFQSSQKMFFSNLDKPIHWLIPLGSASLVVVMSIVFDFIFVSPVWPVLTVLPVLPVLPFLPFFPVLPVLSVLGVLPVLTIRFLETIASSH